MSRRHRRHERIRVQIRVRQYVHRVIVTAAFGLACLPTLCQAQESSLIAPADELADARQPATSRSPEAAPAKGLGVLLPLYASFAGLQVLDAHSTTRALQNGGVEGNPLVRNLASQPVTLVALKAGVTASTILLTERLRKKNRAGAIALMVALDSVYSMVVVHNYRAIP
jgi:hypothetical protein